MKRLYPLDRETLGKICCGKVVRAKPNIVFRGATAAELALTDVSIPKKYEYGGPTTVVVLAGRMKYQKSLCLSKFPVSIKYWEKV